MSLEDDIRNLTRIPLFADVEIDALRLIAFSAETRILRAGDILFRKGEVSDGGFVVISGSLSLDPEIEGGRGLQAVGPYSLVGELALMTQTERPVSAVARDATTVLKISRPVFQRVLKEFPRTAARLRLSIESRLIAFTKSVATQNRFTESSPG
ncbi:MAG: cyclic nucleotide-binding domain-containing protein [Beijerinckiaceae bacterium]|jgi:CRP-like cAMP-binding protein|nr:cyclic nucleotide-binding domain-containing protein [Beijerinckiaceae bacterium]